MSFEAEAVSFRMFYGPADVPADLTERLLKYKASAMGAIVEHDAGWVTGRHLMDTAITADSIRYAGYLRATLRQAVRAVPAEILKAECRMEELAHIAANSVAFVNRKTRMEIRKAVNERLLPQQTPRLRGIPLVHMDGSEVWYAGASSDGQVDALLTAAQLAGIQLVPMSPETLATRLCNVDMAALDPIRFSEVAAVERDPGGDFLTWLWYLAEANRGMIQLGEDGGSIGILIEGPLLFAGEGTVELVQLRSGCPTASNEANTALAGGKRLVRCKITMAIGDQIWKCGFDARRFSIGSLALPETEELDPISRFQARMNLIGEFGEFLRGIFRLYVMSRVSPNWPEYQQNMATWAAGRQGRP